MEKIFNRINIFIILSFIISYSLIGNKLLHSKSDIKYNIKTDKDLNNFIGEDCSLLISCIKNRTNSTVKLNRKNNNFLNIKPNLYLENITSKLKIPFISINSYMKEFVKDVHFVPKKALKLSINNKSYALWFNEEGIIYCSENKLSNQSKACCVLALSNLKKAKNKENRLNLILDINKDNNIDIKPIIS